MKLGYWIIISPRQNSKICTYGIVYRVLSYELMEYTQFLQTRGKYIILIFKY